MAGAGTESGGQRELLLSWHQQDRRRCKSGAVAARVAGGGVMLNTGTYTVLNLPSPSRSLRLRPPTARCQIHELRIANLNRLSSQGLEYTRHLLLTWILLEFLSI